MASIIVKISDGKDIRRFTASTENISYSTIHKNASEAFGLGAKAFKLKYKDDEGDQITMSTDSELADAVTYTKTLEPPVLRLTLGNVHAHARGEHASRTRAEGGSPTSNTAAESADLAALFQNIKEQLPGLVEQLPEAVKTMLPNMEVDLSASAAATAAAAHAHAFAYGHAHPAANPNMEGYHPEVECDKTGQCPIVGTRFRLKGHNWDLCASEFAKLPEAEKAQFEAIEPPCYRPKAGQTDGSKPETAQKGFHPGVTCDKTGQCPIFGWRFHLTGKNYDLCEAEFNKLPDAEKAAYERIAPPWPCWSGRGGLGRGCGKGFGSSWGGGGGRGWGGGWGGHWGGKGGCGWEAPDGTEPGKGFGKGKGMHDGGKPAHKLLAARFVCDVSIFDGTQMAPSTKFTKIWRLKNTGAPRRPIHDTRGSRLEALAGLRPVSSRRSISAPPLSPPLPPTHPSPLRPALVPPSTAPAPPACVQARCRGRLARRSCTWAATRCRPRSQCRSRARPPCSRARRWKWRWTWSRRRSTAATSATGG